MALSYKTGYDFVSQIGTKQIKFKMWTAKDERKYFSLLEKENQEFSDKVIYDTLLLPCMEDKNLVLSASEQKKLLMDIRIESISKYAKEKDHKCTNCGEKTDIKVEIKDFMNYKEAKYEDIVVGNLKFNMGAVRTNKEKEVLKLADGLVNYVFNDFLLHIHSIEIDGVLETGFKFKELKKFMDDLPTKIFDEVFNKYKDMVDDLELEYEFVCPKCEEKEKIDFSGMPDLLWV